MACRCLRSNAASRHLRPQFHLEAGRRGRARLGRLQDSGVAGFPHQPTDHRVSAGAGSSRPGRRSRKQAFPDHRGPARRGCHRLHCDAAAIHQSNGQRVELDHETARRIHGRTVGGTAENRDAAGARDRNHEPEPYRCELARYLCRQPRRRADSRRPDQARPHRDDERRDLAIRSARLHRAVGSVAGRDHRGHSEQLFRLPGDRDPESWWRSPEIHGRRPARGFPDRRICRRRAAGLLSRPRSRP